MARRYVGIGRKKLNYRSRRRLNKVDRPSVRRKCDKNLTPPPPPHKAPRCTSRNERDRERMRLDTLERYLMQAGVERDAEQMNFWLVLR